MGAVTLSSRGLTLARGYFDGGDKRARAERVFMCTRCLYSWGTRNLICGLRRLICGLDLVNVGKLIRRIDNLARRWMGKFVILFRAVEKFLNIVKFRVTIRWYFRFRYFQFVNFLFREFDPSVFEDRRDMYLGLSIIRNLDSDSWWINC